MSHNDKNLSDTDLEVQEITKSAASINFSYAAAGIKSEPIIKISRGRGKWSANVKQNEEQSSMLGNGFSNKKFNDDQFDRPQQISRTRQFEDSHQDNGTQRRQNSDSLQQISRTRQFEDSRQVNGAQRQNSYNPQPIPRTFQFDNNYQGNGNQETETSYNGDDHRTRRSFQEHATEHVNKPPLAREIYIPEDDLTGEALFEDRKNKRYRTGLNFDAYESIPCDVTGDRVKDFRIQTFENLNLKSIILQNIMKMGYEKPTPIQKYATPYIMSCIDVMACAQTGSGKTAAFLLPILNALLDGGLTLPPREEAAAPFCLILAPTRELAKQIHTECTMYATGTRIISCCVYGGVHMGHQKRNLQNGCHILIATPGRLLQFTEENHITLDRVKYFILDEADRMIDLGFMPDVRKIVQRLPVKGERVSAMFSATFPQPIQKAAEAYLENYVFVTIGTVGGACCDIQQTIYNVDRSAKRRKLREIFTDISQTEKVLIFCAKKTSADILAGHLATEGISTTSIHGDRLQSQRELALKEFTEGTRQVLVATSVAARGLDIPKVSTVINYDMPDGIDDYVHRIGRTGRVGHVGKAISFYDHSYNSDLAPALIRILRDANQEVPDWLERTSKPDDSRFNNQRRFGATDYRMKNRGSFTGVQSVPDAVEVDDDDWGQNV